MKITGYRTETYTFRLDRAIGDCNYPAGTDGMGGGFLWIDTDEGITGVAPMTGDVESLFSLIEGEDPREVIGLWRRMVDEVHKGGLTLASGTIAAIDIALWDLKAKIAGEPLWRTFGALEGRARAYASGIDYNLSDALERPSRMTPMRRMSASRSRPILSLPPSTPHLAIRS